DRGDVVAEPAEEDQHGEPQVPFGRVADAPPLVAIPPTVEPFRSHPGLPASPRTRRPSLTRPAAGGGETAQSAEKTRQAAPAATTRSCPSPSACGSSR